jgi:hypothetical protein
MLSEFQTIRIYFSNRLDGDSVANTGRFQREVLHTAFKGSHKWAKIFLVEAWTHHIAKNVGADLTAAVNATGKSAK